MREPAAREVLNSIIEITAEQDCVNFRRSLAGTVRQLMPVDEITFAVPVPARDGAPAFQAIHRETRDSRPAERLAGVVISDAQRAEMDRSGHCLARDARGCLLVLPVRTRDSLAEVLLLRAPDFSPQALDLLQGYTRLYQNFRAIIAESESDVLTGLLNRRSFDSRLGAVLGEAHRRQASASYAGDKRGGGELHDFLALIDIDHFKRINDTLGHLYGDEVLILLSRLLRETIRSDDVVFRFGGEEFVVILVAQSADGARIALDRLREAVASHRFPQLGRVTISIGATQLQVDDIPPVAVGRADQALYYAKENGRNRVCDYEALLRGGELKRVAPSQDVELF